MKRIPLTVAFVLCLFGGSLYSDAMGDEGTPEGTYLGMLEHNVDALVEGLR